MRPLRAVLALIFATPLFANDSTSLAKEAQALLNSGSYAEALKAYQALFVLDPSRLNLGFFAAIAAAKTGQDDLAFEYLDQGFPAGEEWSVRLEMTTHDSRLRTLRETERWPGFFVELQRRKSEYDAGPFPRLKQDLLEIFESDQAVRKHLSEVEKIHGAESAEVKEATAAMTRTDVANLQRVEAILAEHGWLAPGQVGQKASVALWLVIQHSDLATQRRYLPMIRVAVAEGKVRASEWALLEDRVACREGRKQTYGSQIGSNETDRSYYVLPLADPHTVDARRAAVGLNSLAEYVKAWGIVWDPDVYLEKLPEFEKWAQASREKGN